MLMHTPSGGIPGEVVRSLPPVSASAAVVAS